MAKKSDEKAAKMDEEQKAPDANIKPQSERVSTPSHNPPDANHLGEGRPAPIVPEDEQVAAEGDENALQNPDGQRPSEVSGRGPVEPPVE